MELISNLLNALPCPNGLLCEAKYERFGIPCCKVIKAIRQSGQLIEIQLLEDDYIHILIFKGIKSVRSSLGVVKLIDFS